MQRIRWFTPLLVTLLIVVALLSVPATTHAGGWAVITLVDLPHRVEVRTPTPIEFVVRQHGHPDRLMSDLTPQVTATYAGHTVQVTAEAGDTPGHYHATLTLPVAGTWEWSIQAFTMDVAMPPLIAYDPAASAAVSAAVSDVPSVLQQVLTFIGWEPVTRPSIDTRTAAEQGRDLYIAKGCTTCHIHAEVDVEVVTEYGPDLTAYEPDPDFVRLWLRNAAAFTSTRDWPMPTLELTDSEIDALIAFLAE